MTTLRQLYNIPEGKYFIMEMFKDNKKVAEDDISEMNRAELKLAEEIQESQGRTFTYKTIAYPYATFIGSQKTLQSLSIPIYNVVGGKRHGSTVTKETLDKEGIKIVE